MSDEEIRKHCNSYGYSDGEVYAYKDGYQQGRADAIDEFVEKCEKWIEKVNDIRCDNSAMLTIANIRELAEQLRSRQND